MVPEPANLSLAHPGSTARSLDRDRAFDRHPGSNLWPAGIVIGSHRSLWRDGLQRSPTDARDWDSHGVGSPRPQCYLAYYEGGAVAGGRWRSLCSARSMGFDTLGAGPALWDHAQ